MSHLQGTRETFDTCPCIFFSYRKVILWFSPNSSLLDLSRLSCSRCIFLIPYSHSILYSFQVSCPQWLAEESSAPRRTGKKKCLPRLLLYVILLINWVRIRCGGFVALLFFTHGKAVTKCNLRYSSAELLFNQFFHILCLHR